MRPRCFRSVWLPTATAFEMAGIIEAMMAANRLMETLTSTQNWNGYEYLGNHRLDGCMLIVYNDNFYAAEYSYPNWHTALSVAANGAGHLLPLAEIAWALSTSLQSRGVIIRLMRPPRGRLSRRIRYVDRRTHAVMPIVRMASVEVESALGRGNIAAIGMMATGRDSLLRRL